VYSGLGDEDRALAAFDEAVRLIDRPHEAITSTRSTPAPSST
jgi:hypothetical protein